MHDAPNVLLLEDFISDADALFHGLRAEVPWDERMFARKTASYGTPYNYAQITYDAAPMHPRIAPVLEQLSARLGFSYDNCLLNLYEHGGHGMGFHVDDMTGLVAEAGVAIVSLGAPRTLVFHRIGDKAQTAAFRLRGGSLLWTPAAVQMAWKHGLPAEPGAGPRISMTFRATAR